MQSDFEGYESWRRIELDAPDPRLGGGRRLVYVNDVPPRGSAAFPRCTMLVKVVEDGPEPADWLRFGMAKRGGGYNPDGAAGWEWFDLREGADGDLLFDWRGPSPPDGRGYAPSEGEDAVGDCNVCHAAAAGNDFVLTPELSLAD